MKRIGNYGKYVATGLPYKHGFKKGHTTNVGKRGAKRNEATKLKMSLARFGKIPSKETRRKMSEAKIGEKNYNWKDGLTEINLRVRGDLEYRLWREAVFERDNYTCVWCGDNKGGNLNADHIKPFCDYPELRFALDNGRTLCESCHKTTETYGNKNRGKNGRFSKH